MNVVTSKLNIEVHSHTAILTIQNPPANTWDLESLRALPQIISDLSSRQDIWSLVITGQGEKFFSAYTLTLIMQQVD